MCLLSGLDLSAHHLVGLALLGPLAPVPNLLPAGVDPEVWLWEDLSSG